jgi:hypothetical protein
LNKGSAFLAGRSAAMAAHASCSCTRVRNPGEITASLLCILSISVDESSELQPMTRTVVVEQPNYIPWAGYFDLMRQSDVWVWYDDVQYTKRDWRNRNRIAGGTNVEWLTIPVKTKGRFAQRICDVEIDYQQPWARRHMETLRRCYAAAPFFASVFPVIENAFAVADVHLADLTIRLNEALSALLGLQPVFVRTSQMSERTDGRTARLLNICGEFGASTYLSGPAARAYIEPSLFSVADIELCYAVYDFPPYPRGPRPWIPNLSIIDLLAWLGPGSAANYLAAHGRAEGVVAA